MDFIEELGRSRQPKVTIRRPAATADDARLVIQTKVGGGTPAEATEALKRLKALSRRMKVGKRGGASEVIREERS